MNPIIRGYKTIRQVGLLPVLQVGLYRFGLLIGHYRRISEAQKKYIPEKNIDWLPSLQFIKESKVASLLQSKQSYQKSCLNDARLIMGGKCKIFGHQDVNIFPEGFDSSHIWTDYETHKVPLPVDDIKFIWEPARLGWIYSLARAYASQEIPSLGEASWRLIETFLQHNPVNQGPNWMNGQEVALRIFAFVFFRDVFRNETGLPKGWEQTLAQAIVAHARRIPPTLVYAQSQQNNHLLVEAAGLYSAGVFLPDYPDARDWRKTGWELFHKALDAQIQADGTYTQYSTNYHRLMLQIALWMKAICMRAGDEFPETSALKLAAATNWLKTLTDPETGLVPNYGHNDGAYIFPLSGFPFEDYRPVVNAADYFFANREFPAEPDEMTLWFDWLAGSERGIEIQTEENPPIESYRRLVKGNTSATMFAPHFTGRPGQADVLHTEIWRAGRPITLDAGTYLYNASPPWDNALAQTKIHNTVSVFEQNQMQKAGRFLWLDWPKVEWESGGLQGNMIIARHDGYRKYGVVHERQVVYINENVWRVFDNFFPIKGERQQISDFWIHWLLPQWNWSVIQDGVQVFDGFPRYKVLVLTRDPKLLTPKFDERQLISEGILMYSNLDSKVPPPEISNFGWVSPTYGLKEPAVSYRVRFRGELPLSFYSEFQFG